ncbi:MAG: hypothetical protein GTN46_02035 [Gammaproteobacteria bacterium]|nr:hypothetical protein [Gammaproteobacteria bacterium]NIO61657.1 hypothetical protein [Gammaproteobacteria bacterium]NIQ18908.1 hypothetical protein [Gammaproteobacteria bacterium]NIT04957.1 hypothetical protein [Gammaproteobacteria bacterium]NIT40330.1 hypothetical protein [Gammaproteobacteria bacterium]
MKKRLLISLIVFLVGVFAGAGLMLLAYPFIFPPAVVNEELDEQTTRQTLLTGEFIHPNPSDPIHWGKGGVGLYQQESTEIIFLEKDFEVGSGPAYHVYLSDSKLIRSNEDFKAARNTDLGKLKSLRTARSMRFRMASRAGKECQW